MRKTVIISVIFALIAGLLIIGSSKLSYFINLNDNEKLYEYVPEEASIILQVNTKNLIKEGVYRVLFSSNELPFLDSLKQEDGDLIFGVDLEISPILFTETWEKKTALFGLFALNNQDKFNEKLLLFKEKGSIIDFSSNETVGVVCFRYEGNAQIIQEHLKNLAQGNINDINDKLDLKTTFNSTSVLNGIVSNFPLSDHDYLEHVNFHMSHHKGSSVRLSANSENHIEHIREYENQTYLKPEGFHISVRTPRDLSISFLDDSSAVPDIEYLSMNYGGFKMVGFSGGELDLALYLKTNPDKFKAFLKKEIRRNGTIQTNSTLDTISIVGTVLKIKYESDGVCLLGIHNTPEYEINEKALFLKVDGSLSKISKIEGNVGVIQLLLQSILNLNLPKTQNFLSCFEDAKGEIYIDENGLAGKIQMHTKPEKDFFIEGLKMIK